MTNHLTAAEHIAEQSDRIQRLIAEIHQLRQQNATLTAQLIGMPTTDITLEDWRKPSLPTAPGGAPWGWRLCIMLWRKANDLER